MSGSMSRTRQTSGAAEAPQARIDKWLWAARFFKTRSLAQQAIEHGRVMVGGQRVKPARPLVAGDELWLRVGEFERTVRVLALCDRRGPAPLARLLYEETPESLERRRARERMPATLADPAAAITGGRPTKRDRRRLERIVG